MKTNWLQIQPAKWLIMGVLVLLAALTLAFQGGDGDGTNPAHCHTCATRTPTSTATSTQTPIPPLQACQVQQIYFDDEPYTPGTTVTGMVGSPLNITLHLADAQGAPLIGANVDATVTQINDIQAAAIPPLEDQSGTYDGLYTPQNAGTYLLTFSVSDFTGPRFLPCSAEATVRVESKPQQCKLQVDTVPAGQRKYQLNDIVTLSANVTVDDASQSGALVSTQVLTPTGGIEGPFDFVGDNNPYILTYTVTATGVYTFFNLEARDGQSEQRFQPCLTDSLSITVGDEASCGVEKVGTDKETYILNEPIQITATITNTSCANINAIVQKPSGITQTVGQFSGSGNICTKIYTGTNEVGSYTITGQSTEAACTQKDSKTVQVIDRPSPILVINLPSEPIDLCRRSNPDITGTIAISNVTNLTGVQLEIMYDPSFIQVIDAFRRPRPPVQVKPDPIFDPFLNNLVDVRQGKIFFNADARSPITGHSNVIYVDWRLQGRPGITPVTVAAVITDASGAQNVTQTKSLQIIINDTCVQGTVNLQGRADHSGVKVSASSGQQAQSYPSGLFTIPSADPLSFVFPGYLAAQLNAPEGQAANQNNITLLAGDTNADNVINILDMTYLAGRYLSTDSTADLNGDGIVNILDLTLVAANYQRRGPLTTWQ